MGPMEALKLALSKEKESIRLYKKLYDKSVAARDTLLFLLNEEEKHKKLIKEKIIKLRTS